MACVLSWERKQACLLVDLHHACLVMFNAHKKQAEQPHSWLLAQMIGEVLSYLMIPSAFISPVTLSGGRSHTCVIDATGNLHCFGGNWCGQCDVPAELGIVTQVAAGACHTCVIDATGNLHCFGGNDCGQCGFPAELGMVTQVAAGACHTCVIDATGNLHCFGDNDCGQCDVPAEL
eukprot:TRINITY_DN26501_c0_g1_i1.p1 TRINITY_DN26501_c0_g1~~TRINITY_DN26501_c0_g1_i1.p1  ORF type:complete len:176 (-),score=31.61 TRINITY_DN26501_c0_g1_i1:229-756(-)